MSFGLMVPYLVGRAVDDLGAGITWDKVIYYPLVILAANFGSGIFLFLQRRLLINASRHIEFDMRETFYSRLVHQPLEFFHNNRIGDLMARATNDLSAVRQIVGPMILYSFQAIFALAITLPILLNISTRLTLLMLIPLPFVSLTVKFLGDQVHKRFEKIQEFFSDITARAQENLSGVRVVRAYAQVDAEVEQFQKLNREYAKRNLQLVKFAAATRPLLFFFIGLLEDSGYMARVAYLMDRVMKSLGLHGRAFVPMLSGFACAVPAILATRTMERQRDPPCLQLSGLWQVRERDDE
jgi:ATP-binding cassette subfamily B protein